MNTTEDFENVTRFLNGEMVGYVAIVEKYRNMVYTLSLRILKNREEAEEVAQDVFINVYHSLHLFQKRSKLSTWIYRIAYNRSINYLKSQKKNRATMNIDDAGSYLEEDHTGVLEKIGKKESSTLVQKALLKLPETEQIIVTLYYYEELSTREISEITGISTQNVKIKLHRSRKKLYDVLKNVMVY